MKVSRIEIETGEGKILLTVEQAKKLHADLNELFGEKTRVVDRTIIVPDERWPVNPPWSPTPPFHCGTPAEGSPPTGETICLSIACRVEEGS